MSPALASGFFTTSATWEAVRWWTCVVLSHQACVNVCVGSPQECRHRTSLCAFGWLISSCTQHLQDSVLGLQSYESYLPPMNTHTHTCMSFKDRSLPKPTQSWPKSCFHQNIFLSRCVSFLERACVCKRLQTFLNSSRGASGLIDRMAVGRIVLHWLHPPDPHGAVLKLGPETSDI